MKKGDDIVRAASERGKRRHARPLDLDSDDDDDGDAGEEDKILQDEEAIPDKVKAFVLDEDEPHILVNEATEKKKEIANKKLRKMP